MKIIIIISGLILFPLLKLKGQIDSSKYNKNKSDTVIIKDHYKIKKYGFWGNSWCFGASYNLSKSSELGINVGRSYVEIGPSGIFGTIVNMSSWGIGYGQIIKKQNNKGIVNLFIEHSYFYSPPFAFTFRGEYMYNLKDAENYLRPSIGFNFLYFDLLYNYSFKLNGTENDFKHGFIFRIKFYTNRGKWVIRSC